MSLYGCTMLIFIIEDIIRRLEVVSSNLKGLGTRHLTGPPTRNILFGKFSV